MRIRAEDGELHAKLVYLGAVPEACTAHLEAVRQALAPGLATELQRLPGDGHYLSRDNAILSFDFVPAVKPPRDDGLRLHLHLYALEATPNRQDLEFLLLGVDVLVLAAGSDGAADETLLDAASAILGAPPPIVRAQANDAAGAIEALKRATAELLALARA